MRQERVHRNATVRTPNGPTRVTQVGMHRLMSIVSTVNPSGNVVNCGHTIDAVIHRLTGANPTATSHNIGDGGSFQEIATRHGTTFTWQSSLPEIFGTIQSGGHGTLALVGIIYSGGGAHIIAIANWDGAIGICEGQDWASSQPAEVVASIDKAKLRYDSSGANQFGIAIVRWGGSERSGRDGFYTGLQMVLPRTFRNQF